MSDEKNVDDISKLVSEAYNRGASDCKTRIIKALEAVGNIDNVTHLSVSVSQFIELIEFFDEYSDVNDQN